MKPLVNALQMTVADRLIKGVASLRMAGRAERTLTLTACLTGGGGAGFASYGLYLWLAQNFSPITAFMGLGGLFFVFAALSLTAVRIIRFKRRQGLLHVQNELMDALDSFIETAEERYGDPVRENPKTAVTLALAAGYITGEKLL